MNRIELFVDLKVSAPFDGFEYHPLHTVELVGQQHIVEVCTPEQAEFWSVYVHTLDHGLECIADVKTEEEAIELISFLESLTSNYRERKA